MGQFAGLGWVNGLAARALPQPQRAEKRDFRGHFGGFGRFPAPLWAGPGLRRARARAARARCARFIYIYIYIYIVQAL